MSKPVRLDSEAEAELAAAEAWYEEHAGLGGDLVAAVREAGGRLAGERTRLRPPGRGGAAEPRGSTLSGAPIPLLALLLMTLLLMTLLLMTLLHRATGRAPRPGRCARTAAPVLLASTHASLVAPEAVASSRPAIDR